MWHTFTLNVPPSIVIETSPERQSANCETPLPLPPRSGLVQRSFAVSNRDPALVPNGHGNLTADGTIDPLTEAEALRLALTDAASRIGRLIAYLKQFGSGPRIVAAASSGLRQLNLSP